MSADPPLTVLSPLSLCQQIHLSCHLSCQQIHLVSADPPLVSADPPLVSADPSLVSADPPLVSADPPTFVMSADLDPPLKVLYPLLLCHQNHLFSTFVMSAGYLSQSCLHFCCVSRLLSCQQIHPSQSCLHFCHVNRSTPSQSCLHFCHVSRSTLAVLSPLLSCQQSTSRSPVFTFVMSADPPLAVLTSLPLAVLSPLLSCQQIHLSQSCLHFCHVSRFTLSPLLSCHLLQSCLHFCHVSRSTSHNPFSTFVMINLLHA